MPALLLCPWCRDRSQEDILTEAQGLLNKQYFQISRPHRRLARIPGGKTAHQALGDVRHDERWVSRLSEADAGDVYLRLHAPDRVTIACHRVFVAFRALGGGTYPSQHLKRLPRKEGQVNLAERCDKIDGC